MSSILMSRIFLSIAFKGNLWPPILIIHPQKRKFWHYIFTVISFQTIMTFFCATSDIAKNVQYRFVLTLMWVKMTAFYFWVNFPFNLQLQMNLKSNPSCSDAKESSFLVPTAAHHSPKSLCSWSWGSLYLFRSYPVSPSIGSIYPAESV